MDRLILDSVKRQQWAYAGIGTASVALWAQLAAPHPLLSLTQVLADSICLACVVGPILAIMNWPSREYAMLPLSARESWRARWLVAVVVPSSAVMSGATVAVLWIQLARRGAVGIEQVAIAGVISVALSGVMFATMPHAVALLSAPQGRPRGVKIAAGLVAILTIMSAPFGPVLFAGHVPTRWSDLSPMPAVGLALALAWAAYGFVTTTRLTIGRSQAAAGTSSVGRGAQPAITPLVSSRIAGVPRLFLMGTLGPVGMMVAYAILGESSTSTPSSSLLIVATVIYWSWFPGPSPIQLRLLRILPLSTDRLNMVLLGPSAVGWIGVWGAFLVVDFFSGRRLMSLPTDLFCLLLGFSALGIACQLRWRWGRLIGLALIVGGIVASRFLSLPVTVIPWDIGFGLAMLVIAWTMNRNTLSRTTTIYRQAAVNWGNAARAGR